MHILVQQSIAIHYEVDTCLFQNYFTGLLQPTNIFQHVHCR